jgi:hypothetical protein
MKKIISLGVIAGFTPLFTFAATTGDVPDLFGVLGIVNGVLGFAIPILITLAVVYFIWGVIQFTIANDEEAKKRGRTMIINGLIGLFVIIAFWGIIKIFTNTFGVGNVQLDPSEIPCIPGPGVVCGTTN